jgi:hypothetical protein
MNENGTVVALLCDKFEGKQKLDMYGAVTAFEMKLLLRAFRKQLANVTTCVIFLPVICFIKMDR